MFKRYHGDYYRFSEYPLGLFAIAGFLGLSVLMGNEELGSLIDPLKNALPNTWWLMIIGISVPCLVLGLTRKVYTIYAGGPIETSWQILYFLPVSSEQMPLKYLRSIDISFEKKYDYERNGFYRQSSYVLKLIFQDFKSIRIIESGRREKVVKEAEAIQSLTGVRLS